MGISEVIIEITGMMVTDKEIMIQMEDLDVQITITDTMTKICQVKLHLKDLKIENHLDHVMMVD